jgi:rhodanese-related sulfurtransferase
VAIKKRTEGEWEAGRIAGSLNASFLPPWSFKDRVQPLIQQLPKDAEIYVICLSAHRSIGALKWLKAEGVIYCTKKGWGLQITSCLILNGLLSRIKSACLFIH